MSQVLTGNSRHYLREDRLQRVLTGWRYYNNEYLVWAHLRTHPVVQIVMNAFVTDSELELLQKIHVIHHIKGAEDVKAFLSVEEKILYVVIMHNTNNPKFRKTRNPKLLMLILNTHYILHIN